MWYTNDKAKIIDYIKANSNVTELNHAQNLLIDALMDLIPFIGKLEEEDRKIKFDLAVGIDSTVEKLHGRYYKLQNKSIAENDTTINKNEVFSMIKKVIVLSNDNSDIYVYQKDGDIEVGVYCTDLEKTGTTEKSLIDNGFVIFHSSMTNKINVLGRNQKHTIYLDFSEENINTVENEYFKCALTQTTTYRTWKGIFEKVKRNCHGTILLVVDKMWDISKDNNFSESKSSVDIDLTRGDKNGVDDIYDFDNRLNIFYSMLNYDGITVIDTAGKIRAYNLICKNTYAPKGTPGGARHKAFASLKVTPENERAYYKAIYFQSQEGEVEFFEYSNPDKCKNLFNPLILMEYEEKAFMDIVKNHIEEKNEFERQMKMKPQNEYTQYLELRSLLNELQNAHDGIDNFANEVGPASNLYTEMVNKHIPFINGNKYIANEIINTVFDCWVGNSYGYSWVAGEYYEKVLGLITSSGWKDYFDGEYYVCENLAWSFSNPQRLKRWKMLCSGLKLILEGEKYMKTYSSEQFAQIYKAYCKINEQSAYDM